MGDAEIPNWLKRLPLAPEFRPTDTEFADPIAYISKIEKEASVFGICKVIPPLPRPSKKYVLSNLNKSLSKCPELSVDTNSVDVCSSSKPDSGNEASDGEVRAVFTTRHQELGQNAKPTRKAVQPQPPAGRKQVWQSGEIYTLEQFESKSKAFARNQLGMIKELSPVVVESLFWKAASEKPIYVEYANDVPGSGFGEPEGSFRYFHRRRRRRRRRTFNRNGRGSYTGMKYQVDNMANNGENKGESTTSTNSTRETSKVSISLQTILSNQASQLSRQKSPNAANEIEGTAGWKLSNSPWNLQVIARSPGSLTRFMPDDIPGVTSPMVYIGMLFSWFAWHVEDHELHSMNFLHTGSPKTWYAVPGDYAFSFEEVIRNQAYGGSIDRLAALTLLGEKTTLLSPEVVVESGIPCCRLVQYPGEFVVTFPRAYHIGFSHGFNCGEAANFGTSQWLKVAKEAAVRRAVMNHLPMLSHQQLLYLLTMSFISRVPRSLLPGARSSRLRDRQKEERELSVKKAFIEDILNENDLLAILLGKDSSYHLVLWDLESLPSPSKDSELCSSAATVVSTPREDNCHENKINHDLYNEMSLYMESVNDLYVDEDDLSYNFEIDSGTLACVSCGILGFPFMAVVQPSERASMDLLQNVELSKPAESQSPPVLDDAVEGFVSDAQTESMKRNESCLLHQPNGASSSAKAVKSMVCSSAGLSAFPDLSPPPKALPVSSEARFDKGWSATRGFLRPRIFCLEHAIPIEEMLRAKGGANVLVICHSDFQKVKAHAAAIAEEIGSPFGYNEIPLADASQEDLNLIDLAIDDEQHDECGEDWTSKLSINLRYCVKVRKNSPSKQVQHALALGGLFPDPTPSSNTSNLKWPLRKTRSKRNSSHSVREKPSESIQMEKDEVLGEKLVGCTVRKEVKLLQYSRKSFKSKPSAAARHCGGPDEHSKIISQNNLCNFENTGKSSSALGVLDSNGNFELQHDIGVPVSIGDLSGNFVPSQIADTLLAATSGVKNVEAHIEDNLVEEVIVESKVSDSRTGDGSEMQHDIKVDEISQENEKVNAKKSLGSLFTAVESTKDMEMQRENQIMEEISTIDMAAVDTCGGQCSVQSDGDFVKEASDLVNSAPLCAAESVTRNFDAEREETMVENLYMNTEVVDCVEHQEIESAAVLTEESMEVSIKMNAVEEMQIDCENHCLLEHISGLGVLDSNGTSELQRYGGVLESIKDLTGNSVPSQLADSLPAATSGVDNVEAQKEDNLLEEIIEEVKASDLTAGDGSVTQHVVNFNESVKKDENSYAEKSAGSVFIAVGITESFEMHRENQIMEEVSNISEGQCSIPYGGDVMKEASDLINLAPSCIDGPVMGNFDTEREQSVVENSQTDPEEVHCDQTMEIPRKTNDVEELQSDHENCCLLEKIELENTGFTGVSRRSTARNGSKRRRDVEQQTQVEFDFNSFIRSPCEGLRPRAVKEVKRGGIDSNKFFEEKPAAKKVRKPSDGLIYRKEKQGSGKGARHKCDIEGCRLSFQTKVELLLHKRNRCPHEGCGKKFSSHKYAVIHCRVHDDDRPLKCPWKGCTMSFKWAWARTEHIRVHTGERPYKCKVEGCGLTFRFVSDFSRHRRKTGHYVDSSPT